LSGQVLRAEVSIVYLKAHIKGHAIHPMLIAFPVAFYSATVVTFIVYAATGSLFWFQFATVSAWVGVVSAVVAAVPGFMDWSLGIPKGTRAKTQGLRHLVLNVAALVAFLLTAIIATTRWAEAAPGAGWPIFFSLVGFALTVPAGYLGWELVRKHHVGVDLSAAQERLERGERPERRPRAVPVQQAP
jgi:uncharacterized membrane protein